MYIPQFWQLVIFEEAFEKRELPQNFTFMVPTEIADNFFEVTGEIVCFFINGQMFVLGHDPLSFQRPSILDSKKSAAPREKNKKKESNNSKDQIT